MKSYSWILILVLFLSGFSSCHSDSEKYKDILQEGSWYVYDIDYSYKLYDDFETPEFVIVKTCSDSLFSIGQKNCQLFVAKLRNFLDSHNRMVLY